MVPYNSLVLLLHINFGAILVQGANSFGNGPGNGLKVDYEWTTVDFVWPDAKTKEKAVKKGRHDPTRIAILDVDVYNRKFYSSLNIFCLFDYNIVDWVRYDSGHCNPTKVVISRAHHRLQNQSCEFFERRLTR